MAAHGDEDVEEKEGRVAEPDASAERAAMAAEGAGEGKVGPSDRVEADSAAADGAQAATAVAVAPAGGRPTEEAEDATGADEPEPDVGGAEPDTDAEGAQPRSGMTPRQARRVRAVVSGVVMVVVAVALVLRLGSVPSLLTVAGYGIALVLSGTAIVLSRRGRTRVATAVLACGVVAIVLAERALAAA